jgi:YfiR/HmsC-like
MRLSLLLVGCWLSSILISPAPSSYGADSAQKGEYRLKAAFLYNFAKFTEWPSAAFSNHQAPHIVCIVGEDPFGLEIDQLTAKTVHDRQLTIKRLHAGDRLLDCHLLYVSRTEIGQAASILHALQKTPVLTVCDSDGCAEAGFMFNMRMTENRIALDLNLDAVQQAQLKISSQLIKLTRIVKGQP